MQLVARSLKSKRKSKGLKKWQKSIAKERGKPTAKCSSPTNSSKARVATKIKSQLLTMSRRSSRKKRCILRQLRTRRLKRNSKRLTQR